MLQYFYCTVCVYIYYLTAITIQPDLRAGYYVYAILQIKTRYALKITNRSADISASQLCAMRDTHLSDHLSFDK